jgi:predicted DNA-binding protein
MSGGKKRVNAFIPAELDERIVFFEQYLNHTRTDIIRKALEEYLARLEEEMIQKELEEGYKANADYYRRTNKEWQFADSV